MERAKHIFVAVLRILLEPAVFFGAMYGLGYGFGLVTGIESGAYGPDSEFGPAFMGAYMALSTLVAYSVAVFVIEWRGVSELDLKKLPVDALAGVLYGFLALSSLIAIMYGAGSFHVTGVNESFPFLQIFAWVSFFAISEEVIFRGFIYRIFEERFGTWAGLALSSLPFGLAHLANPGATWFSTVSIVFAGLWLGILFTASAYRLWVPIFVHIVWNFAQALYGTPVSGTNGFGNYLESNVTGPEWFTGGDFGPEGSYMCLALLIVMFAAGYRYARQRNLIVPLQLSPKEVEIIEEVVEEVAEEVVEAAL
ncbi:MAG: CPBP family intramembrane metalloprotease [Alphaproteobacteria bacterium]|nr:MAG: CPBP family intramembrane metalloprotease [Alphaproteobacteria bacterium]